MPDPENLHPSQRIIRHEAKDRDFIPATGDPASIDAIVEHFEKVYKQKVDLVFHEIISDGVHIDVHYLKPTKTRNTHVLFTTGMSDLPMHPPEDDPDLTHAELFLILPSWWKLGDKHFDNELNYWPIRWLKQLARLPHEYESWLGAFHTIPNGDPPEPFAPDTRFCCMMLTPPVDWEEKDWSLKLPSKTVSFFMLFPLFKEEVDYKLRHGAESLLDKLDAVDVDALNPFDPSRKNSCARKR